MRLSVHPCPFGPGDSVELALAATGDRGRGAIASAAVYDVSGRLVRRLAVGTGDGQVSWDGRDAFGSEVAGGVYFVRAGVLGGGMAFAKLVYLK
jgi:hypothetical protein